MKYEIVDNVLVIRGDDRGFEVLSTGVEGGRRAVEYVLNIQVSRDFPHDNPEGYIKGIARSLQLKGDYVALLTAVEMRHVQVLSDSCATVFVTAGVRSTSSLGTVNVIVVSSKALSEGAMAGSIITATESKTRALFDLGFDFTGTPTDAVVVAYEKSENSSRIAYAGLATHFGRRVGALIRQGVINSLTSQT
ncbi:MAG: adenosylcobinamide amidohydrolase [Halobacteriota archaeon]